MPHHVSRKTTRFCVRLQFPGSTQQGIGCLWSTRVPAAKEFFAVAIGVDVSTGPTPNGLVVKSTGRGIAIRTARLMGVRQVTGHEHCNLLRPLPRPLHNVCSDSQEFGNHFYRVIVSSIRKRPNQGQYPLLGKVGGQKQEGHNFTPVQWNRCFIIVAVHTRHGMILVSAQVSQQILSQRCRSQINMFESYVVRFVLTMVTALLFPFRPLSVLKSLRDFASPARISRCVSETGAIPTDRCGTTSLRTYVNAILVI